MTRGLAIVVAFAALSSTGRAHADTPDHHRGWHLAIDAAALGVFVVGETVLKDSLVPARCRWCADDALDRHVRSSLVWGDHDRADALSNYTAYLLPFAGATAAFYAAGDQNAALVDDLIPVVEAAIASQLAVGVVKLSVGRQRPYAHASPESPATSEDNLSFPSGHTSFAFAIATSAGLVAHRRHYRGEAAVWAGGYTLAALSGYLRIAADKHYFTDVMTGAAIGALSGLFVPALTGSLPHDLGFTPIRNGVAMTGSF